MWLGTEGRDFLELSIAGYQFPDAGDPQLKYSWHMIQGRVGTASEAWDFRWQVLTCDEPAHHAAWLREAAEASALGRVMPAEGPGPIPFTEPDLAFEVESYCRGVVVIRVELDLEFKSPSNKPNYFVRHPNVLHIRTSIEKLGAAAADWESDLLRYPDGLSTGTRAQHPLGPVHRNGIVLRLPIQLRFMLTSGQIFDGLSGDRGD